MSALFGLTCQVKIHIASFIAEKCSSLIFMAGMWAEKALRRRWILLYPKNALAWAFMSVHVKIS